MEHRQLPEGAPRDQLLFLQKEVAKSIEWVKRIVDRNVRIDSDLYRKFLNTFISSMYVFSPQGRCSGTLSLICCDSFLFFTPGIEDLKYSQARELLDAGFVQSQAFKTLTKYGYQPVIIFSLFTAFYFSVSIPPLSFSSRLKVTLSDESK